jgi:hypothetical protein
MRYLKGFDKSIITECEVYVKTLFMPETGKYILKEYTAENMYGIHYIDKKIAQDSNHCFFKSINKTEVEDKITEWNKTLQNSLKSFQEFRSPY